MEKYEFDLRFQRRLLAAAWADPKWWKANKDIIRPEFFSDEVLAGICHSLHDLSKAPGGVPDLPGTLEGLAGYVAPGRALGEYTKQAETIWKLRGTNTAYYQDKALEFARRAAMVEAVRDSQQFIDSGELEKIQARIQKALRVGGVKSQSYDYLSTARSRASAYARPELVVESGRVPSGLGPLDAATRGGIGPGEIGCVLGLAGHGKSTLLTNIGKAGVVRGRSGLHISLENSLDVAAAKYDTAILEKDLKELSKLPVTMRKKLEEIRDVMKGKLDIRYFPDGTLTLSQLEGVIEEAGKVDFIIVDYAAKLKPAKASDDKRLQLEDIFMGLRRIAGEVGVPIWTAAQAHRPGVGVRLLGIEHYSECFAIPGIIDLGVSVNWDQTRPAELIVYPHKNRVGPVGFEINCSVDFSRSLIKAN